MQSYTYSVFSSVAIVIHLIINYNLLAGRGEVTVRGRRYRGFLFGILFYYVADALWGLLAGLDWTRALYVETAFFFLSLVVFVFLWGRFAAVYLDLGKRSARIIDWCGCGLLALNLAAIALNPFTDCFYYFDATGRYLIGPVRDFAFDLLIAFNALGATFSLVKAISSRDAMRRRSLMVLISYVTISVAIVLNVVWALTPFTALGCLIVNCFFQVFVIQDEQAMKHERELEQALERARAAEKARSMFFSIVSHDIRTPLNAILGYSELLLKGAESQAEREEALKSIRSSGTTLLQLVNDVLDLAKMDAGELALLPEPVNLSQLTDEVFSSFKMAAGKKGLALVDRTEGVPTVMLDGHRLRQVLFNLIGNAVKFTDHGSVTVAASYAGSTLVVSVSDTGCGIAPDMLMRVLDPFVQVLDPSHAADRAGGTGLGLSICRRIVETMGGDLDVESELGKGSTFKARIPGVRVSTAPSVPVADTKPAVMPEGLPKHVLVVDDSPVNRTVLTAFLKKAGITAIDQAGDGVMAFTKLDSAVKAGHPHDFVFTDFWMPNMNGLELAEKLRRDSRFRRLPVYAVTADSEFLHDDRNKFFTGILLKPITNAKLMDVFRS